MDETPPNGPKGDPGIKVTIPSGSIMSPVRVSGVKVGRGMTEARAKPAEVVELDPLAPPTTERLMVMCPACEHGIDCHSLGDPCGALTSRGLCPCEWTPSHIADHAMRGPKISATLVKVGQNYGDHAQDDTTAVEVPPGETVEAFAIRLLKKRWVSPHEQAPEYGWRIELRMVQPVGEEDD